MLLTNKCLNHIANKLTINCLFVIAMEDKSIFLLPNNQRFVELDSSQAFENLTKQEKLYAHYLSQVSVLAKNTYYNFNLLRLLNLWK